MFNDIKTAMTSKGESAFKDVLKFEAGKTYNLRLVPNINQPKKSIFHYYHHLIAAVCETHMSARNIHLLKPRLVLFHCGYNSPVRT